MSFFLCGWSYAILSESNSESPVLYKKGAHTLPNLHTVLTDLHYKDLLRLDNSELDSVVLAIFA